MNTRLNHDSPPPGRDRRQLWQEMIGFQGAPADYWPLLARTLAACLGGELAVLYVGEGGGAAPDWSPLACWPALAPEKLPPLAASVGAAALAQARAEGLALAPASQGDWRVGLIAFHVDAGQRELVLAVHIGQAGVGDNVALRWLAAYQAAPACYELVRARRAGERDAARLAQTLEVLGRVHDCADFDQAALVVANELAQIFACETVSLSWRAREGLRACAISFAEKVDRRSELSALLEEAGQEALAQEREIAWPAAGKCVTLAHARYAELQQPGHLYTLPLLRPGNSGEDRTAAHLGALTLERQRLPFSAAEQWALRMIADLLTAPLRQLELRSRPLPRRLAQDLWRSVPARFKPVTADGRKFARLLALAVAVLLVLPLPYAVDAGAIVKTDAMAFVGAPFDGYLESSPVSLGSAVAAGDPLFAMATRELSLERAGILADMAQYAREAEKRRSASQLPEMQIAEAQLAQAEAKLRQVDYRLENALARTPLDGVVIEGEPGKNIGGAVRRGEVVVKVAAVAALYAEAAVRERDLSRVEVGQRVRLALIADPGATYILKVTRIVPAAAVKDGENTFPARIELADPAPAWWRPGMSGVAKIEVGWRPLIWIATHRLVDYLRLALWVY